MKQSISYSKVVGRHLRTSGTLCHSATPVPKQIQTRPLFCVYFFQNYSPREQFWPSFFSVHGMTIPHICIGCKGWRKQFSPRANNPHFQDLSLAKPILLACPEIRQNALISALINPTTVSKNTYVTGFLGSFQTPIVGRVRNFFVRFGYHRAQLV